jgi:hypothetical protein
MNLTLETRDPQTNQLLVRTRSIDPARTAIIVVDPWNYHWCMTACERVNAMAPRWRRALAAGRKLGMQVLWAPSDVVASYAATPQRQRALAVELVPVPKVRDLSSVKFTGERHHCLCQKEMACQWNYGHDAMTPDLPLMEQDLIVSTTQEAYALLKQQNRNFIIYMGLHTNMCLFAKPAALKWMYEAGVDCAVCRDINDAFIRYDPATGYTPDDGTAQTDDDLQRGGIDMINMVDELRKVGAWNDDELFETVRIVPWGKPMRPSMFEDSSIVTLTTPHLTDVQIRYTTDGTVPSVTSSLYEKPLKLTETTTLQAAAFRGKEPASLVSDAFFVRLPPQPPLPDVYVDELELKLDPYAYQENPAYAACFWAPLVGKSFEGNPLRIRGINYEHGLGCRAPTAISYAIRPQWKRFVGLAGVDDNLLDQDLGRNLAAKAAVIFKVFIDGQEAAVSPVMRISQEDWRFDVKIPAGARMINLVCTNVRGREVMDYGNWANAGFVM